MHIFYNIPPQVFSVSAVAVGFLLVDGATPNEQNALGNWLMLVSQYLCTNAAIGQLQQSKTKTPGSFNERTGQSTINNQNVNDFSTEETVQMLTRMVEAMNKEIEDLKRQL